MDPEPVTPRLAPDPTTIAALVLVPPVRELNALEPLPHPEQEETVRAPAFVTDQELPCTVPVNTAPPVTERPALNRNRLPAELVERVTSLPTPLLPLRFRVPPVPPFVPSVIAPLGTDILPGRVSGDAMANVQVPALVIVHVPDAVSSFAVPRMVTEVTVPLPAPPEITVHVAFTHPDRLPLA